MDTCRALPVEFQRDAVLDPASIGCQFSEYHLCMYAGDGNQKISSQRRRAVRYA
jgi:hypothetical protein